ncbi:hypothetical protein BCIN_01g04820 [Botrytis cinerea B05.10]|uniref:Uncharacterized protein n=2 Tax=Botryotinia fuckeliana TaxID=40559 RepID=A0A384J5G1_BOTFB|nr:hypothetical protein BCIN_01g04820 [Botrytis cinerea B05.10]ATZ45758.1 hypothetical protein BCIN_01g04820 [Botrytis cinerea B05.10]CCD45411.1 hypothetical protein BofuT4_P044290.1 [Botrytis cinerea T4]
MRLQTFLLAVSLIGTAIAMAISPRIETNSEVAAEGALEAQPNRDDW